MKIIRYLCYCIYIKLQSGHNYIVYERYRKKYNINETFGFNGNGIILGGDGVISIGANIFIGENSSITSVEGMGVSIGDNFWNGTNVLSITGLSNRF